MASGPHSRSRSWDGPRALDGALCQNCVMECIHGLESSRCETCKATTSRGSNPGSEWSGKSFALVYVPSLRRDTLLHLNREGDHWKLRWYNSPSQPAVELAQSGRSSRGLVLDLQAVLRPPQIAYPHSSGAGGVSIKDSRYWFDEIAKMNKEHGIDAMGR